MSVVRDAMMTPTTVETTSNGLDARLQAGARAVRVVMMRRVVMAVRVVMARRVVMTAALQPAAAFPSAAALDANVQSAGLMTGPASTIRRFRKRSLLRTCPLPRAMS